MCASRLGQWRCPSAWGLLERCPPIAHGVVGGGLACVGRELQTALMIVPAPLAYWYTFICRERASERERERDCVFVCETETEKVLCVFGESRTALMIAV